MNALRDELNEVINSLKIEGIEFVRMNDWQWVMKRIANKFLIHGMLSLDRIWLWDSIKEPYESCLPKNCVGELNKVLKKKESYWFIVSDEDGKYWVLDATGKAIIEILSESGCFEYYITDKNITWLVCENHHGMMVFKGLINEMRKNA